MKYVIETLDGITIVRFLESPVFEDITEAIDELSLYQPGLRLWDLGKGLNLSSDELRKIAEHGKRKVTAPAKIAIVCPSDLSFGLARMYDVYRQQDIIEERVFRTEKEGLTWLNSD